MKEVWSDLVKFETESDRMEGHFAIPSGSLWFDGHFPDDPILPGIALLGLVQETLNEDSRRKGQKVKIKEFKRIRFRNIVRPGYELAVVIIAKNDGDPDSRVFTISHDQDVICSGTVRIKTDAF